VLSGGGGEAKGEWKGCGGRSAWQEYCAARINRTLSSHTIQHARTSPSPETSHIPHELPPPPLPTRTHFGHDKCIKFEGVQLLIAACFALRIGGHSKEVNVAHPRDLDRALEAAGTRR
jgi:hypothetical protein